ncbi:MAG: ComF family protein [Pseudomonadota bacterium]
MLHASQCAVCHSWPSQQVCGDCISRFSPALARCKSCALALPPDLSMGVRTSPGLCMDCIRNAPPLDAMLVAASYAYPWSDLITRYKFGDQPGWAPFFAGLMLDAPGIRQELEDLQPGDLIIPMPLSAERLQSRGFNQAWELASALARLSGSPASADARLLLRTRDTRPQTELKREARLANVKGAFQPDPLRLQAVAGKRIVLVDDVVTSGASIFTAARALRAAGAAHVTGVAIAKTQ